MWHRNGSYRNKNGTFSDNNHFNSHFAFLEALTLMWLISYYKYNLQRLGSLNSKSKYCVMVSQRYITYLWKNAHCQGQLILHYTYHMLIAYLP
jgi:hypothetical protein